MTVNYGDEIKSRLTMKEVVNRYGFQVNSRTSTMLCPFHNDHNSSMHIYSGKRGFFCFACNTGGSVIDFVMLYFNLSFMEACKKLNEDFRLGISIGEELSEEKKRELAYANWLRNADLQLKQAREKYYLTAYWAAYDRYIALDRMKMENEPRKGADGKYVITKAYVYAVKRIDGAWADVEEAAAKLQQFERERDNE